MNKTIKIGLSLFLISILSGCNDNLDNNNDIDTINDDLIIVEPIDDTINQISGVVVDGYISSATVCLDLNKNLLCDKEEPATTTDKKGKYKLDISSLTDTERENVSIISIGGYDETAKKPFDSYMRAAVIKDTSEININPITGLVYLKMKNNSQKEYKKASDNIAKTFNFNSKDINKDIMKNKDKSAYLIGLKIQKVKDMLKTLKDKKEYMEKLSNNILGEEDLIENIIDNVDMKNLNDKKTNIRDMISDIEVTSNMSEEDLGKVQQKIERKKEILDKLEDIKFNNLSGNNLTNEELNNIYKKQIENLSLKIEKLEEIKKLTEKLNMEEILNNDLLNNDLFQSLLYIDYSGIETLEDFKSLIENSNLSPIISDYIIGFIDNQILINQ